jgi:hypothetical protein
MENVKEKQMTLIDRGCWERGCACYDSRIADETIEVVPRNDVLEEVAKEFDSMKAFGDTSASFAAYVRGMKR